MSFEGYQVEGPSAGEELLLALLNTTPTVAGERLDVLTDPAERSSWLMAREAAPETDIEFLRATRDALQRAVTGGIAPGKLAGMLDGACLRPRIEGDRLDWQLAVGGDREIAVRAVLAWDQLRSGAPGRLRPCANEECSLYLIDRSKNNSARWCSMASCGNRLKARRHHERGRR